MEEHGVFIDVLQEVLSGSCVVSFELDFAIRTIGIQNGIQFMVSQIFPCIRDYLICLNRFLFSECYCHNASNPARTLVTAVGVPISSNLHMSGTLVFAEIMSPARQ